MPFLRYLLICFQMQPRGKKTTEGIPVKFRVLGLCVAAQEVLQFSKRRCLPLNIIYSFVHCATCIPFEYDRVQELLLLFVRFSMRPRAQLLYWSRCLVDARVRSFNIGRGLDLIYWHVGYAVCCFAPCLKRIIQQAHDVDVLHGLWLVGKKEEIRYERIYKCWNLLLTRSAQCRPIHMAY